MCSLSNNWYTLYFFNCKYTTHCGKQTQWMHILHHIPYYINDMRVKGDLREKWSPVSFICSMLSHFRNFCLTVWKLFLLFRPEVSTETHKWELGEWESVGVRKCWGGVSGAQKAQAMSAAGVLRPIKWNYRCNPLLLLCLLLLRLYFPYSKKLNQSAEQKQVKKK